MSDLIRLPAPCSADSFITCDLDGYFKLSEGQGANRDAIRMTKRGRLSMPALAAYMTDLGHAESLALKDFTAAEIKHGVNVDHPDKTRADAAVDVASGRVLRLAAWIAAARPSCPADIGLQARLILSLSGPLGCIKRDEYDALIAGAQKLTAPPTNPSQGVAHAA